ncbi:MAG: histidine triad protein [Gemmatimonadetes bacterium]|nr:histidine triad protein [Gemmatimonadota bacterium]
METRKADHQAPCTFCELIHGSAEVSICHEDADAIAFMDIQPVNNGHVLVVPREHHESLLEVPEELGMHLFKITMRLANAIRAVTGCDDLNIVVNSGKAAGQDEPHYHVHIIPRREGDGFDIPLPFNGSEMPDRTVLDAYAVRIISALRDPVRGGGAHGSYGAHHGHDESEAPAGVVASAPRERKTKAWRAERPVEVEVFSEVSHAVLEEGAHGELRRDPQDELRDSA